MTLAGVILAPAPGTRMGKPKALLRWGATTLVGKALDVWSEVCDVTIVVAGAALPEVRAAAAAADLVVANPAFDGPMVESVKAGLAAVPASCDAAIIGPVDQALADAGLLRELAEAHADTPDRALVPTHEGQAGHPVLLPRGLFRGLLELPAGRSLADYLGDCGARLRPLPTARPEARRNINTPEEYRALMMAVLPKREWPT